MSKEEKLKICFYSIKKDYLEGIRHNPPYRESDWHIVYANDIFAYGKGCGFWVRWPCNQIYGILCCQ